MAEGKLQVGPRTRGIHQANNISAYVGYLNRLACEVIVPGPRVLESGNHAEFTYAEIGDHHGVHAAAVEVQALAIAAYINVIGALERVGVVHFELAIAGNDLVDAVPIGVVAVISARAWLPCGSRR